MDQSERRRLRLAQMLDLAQNYRGWTRKDLARALGRDPTKLIPGSGVPKLDLVVDLAKALDWSLEDVVSHFWSARAADGDLGGGGDPASDYEALDCAAKLAHREGRYLDLIDLSRRAYAVGKKAEQRARAMNREAGGWDGIGRYENALKAIQRGLQEQPVSGEYRRMLQSNLANEYYSLWSLLEAKAIANDLLTWYADVPPETVRDRKTRLFAALCCRHTWRRVLTQQSDDHEQLGQRALHHLTEARDGYHAMAEELDDSSFDGIANTCAGGAIEAAVAAGERDPLDAMDELAAGLDRIYSPDGAMDIVGDRLESYGWWCIFGCNIALRSIDDEALVQKYMAVFTNKADEVAEHLDNWAMRERVFTLERARWERASGPVGLRYPSLVDEKDVRIITGTMARFPTFRDTGWAILESAKVIPNA